MDQDPTPPGHVFDDVELRVSRVLQDRPVSDSSGQALLQCPQALTRSRCKLPNVDQDTGVRHPAEPDNALRKYRDVDDGAPKKGCLGMQLCPLFERKGTASVTESWIAVGMDVDVLERGEHHYVKQ